MTKFPAPVLPLAVLCAALLCAPLPGADKALIVADGFPAMEALAARLQAGAGVACELVRQNAIPRSGGKLILLHQVPYRPSGGGPKKMYPGFELRDTEVYLNHVFTSPRHVLLGLKATDPKTGRVYMQDRAGRSAKDLDHAGCAQIVVNAFTWKPEE